MDEIAYFLIIRFTKCSIEDDTDNIQQNCDIGRLNHIYNNFSKKNLNTEIKYSNISITLEKEDEGKEKDEDYIEKLNNLIGDESLLNILKDNKDYIIYHNTLDDVNQLNIYFKKEDNIVQEFLKNGSDVSSIISFYKELSTQFTIINKTPLVSPNCIYINAYYVHITDTDRTPSMVLSIQLDKDNGLSIINNEYIEKGLGLFKKLNAEYKKKIFNVYDIHQLAHCLISFFNIYNYRIPNHNSKNQVSKLYNEISYEQFTSYITLRDFYSEYLNYIYDRNPDIRKIHSINLESNNQIINNILSFNFNRIIIEGDLINDTRFDSTRRNIEYIYSKINLFNIHIDKFNEEKIKIQNNLDSYYLVLETKINDSIITYLKINNIGKVLNHMRYRIFYTNDKDNIIINYNDDFTKHYTYDNNLSNTNANTQYSKMPNYFLGNYTRIFLPNEKNKEITDKMENIINKTNPTDTSDSPKPIFILGYGSSGAGKTSNLIYYRNKDPNGKSEEGILPFLCKKIINENKKKNIEFVILKLMVKEFSVYDMTDSTHFTYDFVMVGDNLVLSTQSKNKQVIIKHPYRFNYNITGNNLDKYGIYEKEDKLYFNNGTTLGQIIIFLVDIDRLVKATTNNPQSSRSHVLVFVDIYFNDNKKTVNLIVGDFAGIENKFNCSLSQSIDTISKQINTLIDVKENDDDNFYYYDNEPIYNGNLAYWDTDEIPNQNKSLSADENELMEIVMDTFKKPKKEDEKREDEKREDEKREDEKREDEKREENEDEKEIYRLKYARKYLNNAPNKELFNFLYEIGKEKYFVNGGKDLKDIFKLENFSLSKNIYQKYTTLVKLFKTKVPIALDEIEQSIKKEPYYPNTEEGDKDKSELQSNMQMLENANKEYQEVNTEQNKLIIPYNYALKLDCEKIENEILNINRLISTAQTDSENITNITSELKTLKEENTETQIKIDEINKSIKGLISDNSISPTEKDKIKKFYDAEFNNLYNNIYSYTGKNYIQNGLDEKLNTDDTAKEYKISDFISDENHYKAVVDQRINSARKFIIGNKGHTKIYKSTPKYPIGKEYNSSTISRFVDGNIIKTKKIFNNALIAFYNKYNIPYKLEESNIDNNNNKDNVENAILKKLSETFALGTTNTTIHSIKKTINVNIDNIFVINCTCYLGNEFVTNNLPTKALDPIINKTAYSDLAKMIDNRNPINGHYYLYTLHEGKIPTFNVTYVINSVKVLIHPSFYSLLIKEETDDVKELRKEIKALEEKINKNKNSIRLKEDTIETSVKNKTTDVEDLTNNLGKKKIELEKCVSEKTQKEEEYKRLLNDYTYKITQINSQLITIKSNIEKYNSSLETLKEKIGKKTVEALNTKNKFNKDDKSIQDAVYKSMVTQIISRDYIEKNLKFFYYKLLDDNGQPLKDNNGDALFDIEKGIDIDNFVATKIAYQIKLKKLSKYICNYNSYNFTIDIQLDFESILIFIYFYYFYIKEDTSIITYLFTKKILDKAIGEACIHRMKEGEWINTQLSEIRTCIELIVKSKDLSVFYNYNDECMKSPDYKPKSLSITNDSDFYKITENNIFFKAIQLRLIDVNTIIDDEEEKRNILKTIIMCIYCVFNYGFKDIEETPELQYPYLNIDELKKVQFGNDFNIKKLIEVLTRILVKVKSSNILSLSQIYDNDEKLFTKMSIPYTVLSLEKYLENLIKYLSNSNNDDEQNNKPSLITKKDFIRVYKYKYKNQINLNLLNNYLKILEEVKEVEEEEEIKEEQKDDFDKNIDIFHRQLNENYIFLQELIDSRKDSDNIKYLKHNINLLVTKLINHIDVCNSTTPMGSLEFLDGIAKLNTTNYFCTKDVIAKSYQLLN
jgi:hypothetical protein